MTKMRYDSGVFYSLQITNTHLHHGWFLGRWFVVVKIDINWNRISATTQAVRSFLSDPKNY